MIYLSVREGVSESPELAFDLLVVELVLSNDGLCRLLNHVVPLSLQELHHLAYFLHTLLV